MVIAPPSGFERRPLVLNIEPAGRGWLRLYRRRFPDPLGFGRAPSRFSDPRQAAGNELRFGVVYAGSSLKACVAEAVVRDRGDGRLTSLPLELKELESWMCAALEVREPLRLVDLRGDGALRMGIPSDVVRGADHSGSQPWALALHSHAERPDGLIYPSRLTGEDNLAVFDRALAKLGVSTLTPLLGLGREFAEVIRTLDLAIL